MVKFIKSSTPRLSPDEGRRQGAAVKSAMAAFPRVEDLREFMNTVDDDLGGTPLAVATASDSGLQKVRASLERHSGR